MLEKHKAVLLLAFGAVVLCLPLFKNDRIVPQVVAIQSGGRGPASLGPSDFAPKPEALSHANAVIAPWQRNLETVLASTDDNDPRLDSEFRELTVEQKRWLRERYFQVPVEDRNQRGKVVFLLTRVMRSAADVEFLRDVLRETPCRSLTDCQTQVASNDHMADLDAVTLNYPQMVILYQLENNFNWQGGPLQDSVVNLLKEAEKFPVASVQERAAATLAKLSRN